MNHYLWWPLVAMCYYTGFGYFSEVNRAAGGRYTLWLWLYGACSPLWPVISRLTTDITFDAALFDAIIVMGGFSGLGLCGAMARFGPSNYIGLGLVIAGLLLLRR